MKKLTYALVAFVSALFIISAGIVQAQTAVDQWGSIGGRTGGTGNWKITTGTPGNAGTFGEDVPTGQWATIRGGFDPVTASESDAIVVTGSIEFAGFGPETWSALRYGMFRHDSVGTLLDAGTDSARWSGKEADAYGYMFTPQSGTTYVGNVPGGTNASQGVTMGGSWISTFGGAVGFGGLIQQAPARAIFDEGTYDWAFSVQPLGDGTNEVRFYLQKQHAPGEQTTYWYGGTLIDTSGVTTTFNGICFGLDPNFDSATQPIREMNLTNVQVGLGEPITVPEAPFQAFYVKEWGSIGGRTGGTGNWTIYTDIDGNAGTVGEGVPTGQWASIRGGFDVPVTATEDRAIVITGSVEFVGFGPETWSALRYGMFRHDSVGTLLDAGTDSARWSGKEADAYGYMFTPQSGTTYVGNVPGGTNASQGVTMGGSWISTFGGAVGFGGLIQQAPARAIFDEGTYDWAFSVQPLGDGTNEVRFYLQKQHAPGEQTSYWYGGTLIDTSGVSTTFNGICFALDPNFDEATQPIREMNLTDVQVDLGDPIVVPEAPFQAFYVKEWGSIGGRTGGTGNWTIYTDIDGNAGTVGEGVPTGQWASIRGGFDVPVTATEDRAIVITGSVEFVGFGPETWSALRYGMFRHDSVGTLLDAGTDSARWSGKEADAYGYMFTPQSGTTYVGNIPGGTNASQGVTMGGSWISTFGGAVGFGGLIQQAPARAIFDEGTYDWAFSVQPLGDGTNEVRFYLQKQHAPGEQTTYWYGGTLIDTSGVTTTFNGICFALDPNFDEATQPIREMNLTDVQVDLGDPIVVPPAPFQAFFITTTDWGFIGDRIGGWHLTPGDLDGNVTISGENPPTDWSAVRGAFAVPVTPDEGRALIVRGSIELAGGGFEDFSSLRFGVFHSDSAGTIDSTDVGYAWNGTETAHSGYLFSPQSGTNDVPTWAGSGATGNWGAVVDDAWLSTDGSDSYALGSTAQEPSGAVGGEGVYLFSINVAPQADGTQEVSFTLKKEDGGYLWGDLVADNNTMLATTTFNSVAFAINNSTTTTMHVRDVYVDLGDPIPVSVEDDDRKLAIPTEYALEQNYPNPFNPATTIEFALPRDSEVKLIVHDILGRVVVELANGKLPAGHHRISFDASKLASGVYFFRLKAGDFVSVRKAMLLK